MHLLSQFIHLVEQLCRLQFVLSLLVDIIMPIDYRSLIFFVLRIASFVVILFFTLAFTFGI